MPEGYVADTQIGQAAAFGGTDPLNYLDYSETRRACQKLIGDWARIEDNTKREQAVRYLKDTRSEDLRNAGILKADELYTPLHLVDTNIRSEQPSLVQYLTQSQRALIFASPNEVAVDGIEKLEKNFTNVCRFLGWEVPFIRCFDGCQAHGWDSLEIIYDPDMPGGFAFEHVGHANLIFDTDSENVENQELVLRRINLTAKQLRDFVDKYGFNSDCVEELMIRDDKTRYREESVHEVFKGWFKKDGVCYVFWFKSTCKDYLCPPKPLFLGRRNFQMPMVAETDEQGQPIVDPITQQPVQDYPELLEKEFPIIIYRYIQSSDPRICETRGRIALDEPAQEAASAIQSGLVNGILRAANVYAAPANNSVNSSPNEAPKLTKVVLQNGGVYDQPMIFFHTQYPDPSVIQALQTVVVQNKQEQSKVDFASLNRKDSGKTATEIEAATNKSNELSTIQVILVSIFIRSCYSKAWFIYQNLVLQGKIKVSDVETLSLFGEGIQVDPATGMVVKCAKPTKYILKSSGDIDVIQRQAKIQQMMQAWPVISNTPAAQVFLEDILRAQFPEDAERYIQSMQQAQANQVGQMQGVIQHLGNVLKAIVTGPDGQIKPEYVGQTQQLQMLAQNVQQIAGGQQQPNTQEQPTQPKQLPGPQQ